MADKNEDGILTKEEFKKALKNLIKSDEVPGDKKFLNKVYRKADKADGKDKKVTFESALAAFTEALEVESEEADEAEEAEEEDEGTEEADDGDETNGELYPRCFIDPVFASG